MFGGLAQLVPYSFCEVLALFNEFSILCTDGNPCTYFIIMSACGLIENRPQSTVLVWSSELHLLTMSTVYTLFFLDPRALFEWPGIQQEHKSVVSSRV